MVFVVFCILALRAGVVRCLVGSLCSVVIAYLTNTRLAARRTVPHLISSQSANQLSIYGAVSSSCEDPAQKIPGQTFLSVNK